MPELPEVETTLRGIEPYVSGCSVRQVLVRNRRLRWPVPMRLNTTIRDRQVLNLSRRGKYILWHFEAGHLMLHLGMSGSLRVVSTDMQAGKHDHVDIEMTGGWVVRFTDPRRFGSVLWLDGDPGSHKLLKNLGPEPLGPEFDGDYLYRLSRNRSAPVKSFIMDSRVVAGVGNIYANEALFSSGIHPLRQAGKISRQRYWRLSKAVRSVLKNAIRAGGTTLKDFVGGDGKPGYFKQELKVYGRAELPCVDCGSVLREVRLGQRSTVYCPLCQR